MKKIICLLIISSVILFSAGCKDNDDSGELQSKVDEQDVIISSLKNKIKDDEDLIKELRGLLDSAEKAKNTENTNSTNTANNTKNEPKIPSLPKGVTAETLKKDLGKHKDLIPFEGVLGGEPNFIGDKFMLLLDNYAYAEADDGHIAASMILRYTISEDKSVSWKLIASDFGEGWKLNQ